MGKKRQWLQTEGEKKPHTHIYNQSMGTKINKKIIHYQLRLKGEIKNNITPIKELKK